MVVMFSSMHTKLSVLISSLLNLCMSLVSTFLYWYIWSLCMPLIATFLSSYLRFVHATDCYIFVIIFRFVHATDCYIFVIMKTCGGGNRKPGLNLGFDMHVENSGQLCDSGIRITWVHFSRLLIATPRQWPMEMHYVHYQFLYCSTLLWQDLTR